LGDEGRIGGAPEMTALVKRRQILQLFERRQERHRFNRSITTE